MSSYLVFCRRDRAQDGTPGAYEQATRRAFDTFREALRYAEGICGSREPLVITVPSAPGVVGEVHRVHEVRS